MNAKLAHVHEQFIEMGFKPYADDECLLMHPDYPETDEHQNVIYFEDDEIITNFDDNVNAFVTNKLKPAILNYYKTGPFFGYDDFDLEFDEWGINNEVVYCTLKLGYIPIFDQSIEIYYDIITRKFESSEYDNYTLLEIVKDNGHTYELGDAEEILEIYENVRKRMSEKYTYFDNTLENNIKKLGFNKISQGEFKHPDYEDCAGAILMIHDGVPMVSALLPKLRQHILEQCREKAQNSTIASMCGMEKYGLVVGDWRVACSGLIADITCTHIPIFHTCVSEYNILKNEIILKIDGNRLYSNLDTYFTAKTTREIIMPAINEKIVGLLNEITALKNSQG